MATIGLKLYQVEKENVSSRLSNTNFSLKVGFGAPSNLALRFRLGLMQIQHTGFGAQTYPNSFQLKNAPLSDCTI